MLARELSRDLRLFIAAQPTRGIDVGSIEFVHKRIVETRDAGHPRHRRVDRARRGRRARRPHRRHVPGRIVGIVPGDTPRDVLGLMMAGAVARRDGSGRMSDAQLPAVDPAPSPRGAGLEPRPDAGQEPRPEPDRERRAACPARDPLRHRADLGARRLLALIAGGVLIAATDNDVQRPSGYFFARPARHAQAIWDVGRRAPTPRSSRARSTTSAAPGFANGIKPLTETLTFATPLIAAGLGVALAFRVGLFNIGGRGQMLIAAACAGWVGFSFDLPSAAPARRARRRHRSAARSGADSPDCSRRAPARTR